MRKRGLPFSHKNGRVVEITIGPNSRWTEEQTLRLCELWQEGFSASRAAAALNKEFDSRYSRNAVISKLHRIGLTSPGGDRLLKSRKTKFRSDKKKEAKKVKKDTPVFTNVWPLQRPPEKRRYKPDQPWKSQHVEVVVPEDKRKSLLELEDHDCRWPIGDPQKDGFHFCGAEQVRGQPYCPYHLNASSELKIEGVPAPYPLVGATKKELEPA